MRRRLVVGRSVLGDVVSGDAIGEGVRLPRVGEVDDRLPVHVAHDVADAPVGLHLADGIFQDLRVVAAVRLQDVDDVGHQVGGVSRLPVVVGVLPLHSFRHAEFLHNEVPGIAIPDAIRGRLRDAGEGALRAGIEMGQELLQAIRARFPGVYLMPSFGRFEVVAEILDALR